VGFFVFNKTQTFQKHIKNIDTVSFDCKVNKAKKLTQRKTELTKLKHFSKKTKTNARYNSLVN